MKIWLLYNKWPDPVLPVHTNMICLQLLGFQALAPVLVVLIAACWISKITHNCREHSSAPTVFNLVGTQLYSKNSFSESSGTKFPAELADLWLHLLPQKKTGYKLQFLLLMICNPGKVLLYPMQQSQVVLWQVEELVCWRHKVSVCPSQCWQVLSPDIVKSHLNARPQVFHLMQSSCWHSDDLAQ